MDSKKVEIAESIKDERVRALMALCSRSTATMAKTFFPTRFALPFSDAIHKPIFELIDGPSNKVAIAAPRGFGKTSTVALSLLARHILFGITPFIVYINKSFDAAVLQTENLKRELLSNEWIKFYFGKVDARHNEDYDETFSKKAWVAYETLVFPRGSGQPVRGLSHGDHRPGLIVLDDIEDPKHVDSEDYRNELYEWLYADVLKCVAQVGPAADKYKIIYIDTLKHEDSCLQRILDSHDWASIRLEACDDDFNPTAPEFLSKEKILEEWKAYSENGQSDVFFREMRNIPISTKDAAFKAEYFKYYNLEMGAPLREGKDVLLSDSALSRMNGIENVVIVDPAKSVKADSADTAIIGVAIDARNHRYFIRDIDAGKMMPDQMYQRAFDMAARLNAVAVGWEITGLEEFLMQPILNYMHEHGVNCPVEWLDARGGHSEAKGKAGRVSSLVPLYRQGQIYHNAQCASILKLEAQLKMFPRSKRWDIMDATAYMVQMMERGERYFSNFDTTDDFEMDFARYVRTCPPATSEWRYI